MLNRFAVRPSRTSGGSHAWILRSDEYSWLLSPSTLATVAPKSLLPVAPYLKTPPQCRLSQKKRNPSRPSARAKRTPPMQTLSIASIFQALVLVRRRFPPQNPVTDFCCLVLHHDGPFDACAPSRNRHRTKAPVAAWSAQTRQAIEEDFKASKEAPHYEPPRKKVDAIAEAWGIHEPEPFEDFSAGGGNNDYRTHNTISRRSEETPPQSGRRREAARRSALPPPLPIFAPESDFVPPEPSPPLSSGNETGMKRSKSLIQRIRKMRETPNMPVNNGDVNGVQNTYESGGSGRPTHKSQNSFAGRLAGGGFREQLPPPQESDMYVPAERAVNKDLPRPPNINRANSGEKGYFEQIRFAEQPDLGRKRSLMQRVGVAVMGRK